MNDIASSSEAERLSEDQQAVTDYFSSETYGRTKLARKQSERLLGNRVIWPDPALTPATSFVAGMGGLSALLLFFAAFSPVLRSGLDNTLNVGTHYLAFTIIDQTIVYPAIIGFTFAIVTPMFWYGSVLARFSLAVVLIVPGFFGFLFSVAEWLDAPAGSWFSFAVALLAMFLSIAAVPVLIQMSSHWALSHSRTVDSRLAPSGTRGIMELTGVTAIACAVFVSIDTTDAKETILLYVALGALSSVAVVSMLIAFLRPERRNLFAAAIAALFAFGASFVYCGMHAFAEVGWDELPGMVSLIVISAIYGTVVYACMMWIALWWLRSCGWACVSRQEDKAAREAESRGPWQYWFGS